MLYGIVVLGSFIVQTETEAVTAFDFQLELHILFQFHFKQASAAIVELNSPTVPFGDNDLFQREVCIIQLFQTYLSDIGQQVRTATGIDKFLVELLVRRPVLFLFLLFRFEETPVNFVAVARQQFLLLAPD